MMMAPQTVVPPVMVPPPMPPPTVSTVVPPVMVPPPGPPPSAATPLTTPRGEDHSIEPADVSDIKGEDDKGEWFERGGLMYKTARRGSGVNGNISFEEVEGYVRDKLPENNSPFDPAEEVPYDSMQDFVQTMRQASLGSAFFEWPTDKLQATKCLQVSLERLPPNHLVTVESKKPIPAALRGEIPAALRGESHSTDAACSSGDHSVKAPSHLLDYYHGCSLTDAIQIIGNGFRVGLGAGSEALLEHYGFNVPGVYVAKCWRTASIYPLGATTKPHPADRNGVAGGTAPTERGTFPMRVVFRILADPHLQLWHKKSNQALFTPSCLHITHMIIYALHPTLHHTINLRTENLYNIISRSDMMHMIGNSSFVPISDALKKSVLQHLADNDDEDHGGRLVIRVDTQVEDENRSQLEEYQEPMLLKDWLEQIPARVRVGHAKLSDAMFTRMTERLAPYMPSPESKLTGYIAIEVPYELGLKARTESLHGGSHSAETMGWTDNYSTTQSTQDNLPMLRLAAGQDSQLTKAIPEMDIPMGPKANVSANPEVAARKKAKRQRQQQQKRGAQADADREHKYNKEYSRYLRISAATYARCPENYYFESTGMWLPPSHNVTYAQDHKFVLRSSCTVQQSWKQGATSTKQQDRDEATKREEQATVTSLRLVANWDRRKPLERRRARSAKTFQEASGESIRSNQRITLRSSSEVRRNDPARKLRLRSRSRGRSRMSHDDVRWGQGPLTTYDRDAAAAAERASASGPAGPSDGSWSAEAPKHAEPLIGLKLTEQKDVTMQQTALYTLSSKRRYIERKPGAGIVTKLEPLTNPDQEPGFNMLAKMGSVDEHRMAAMVMSSPPVAHTSLRWTNKAKDAANRYKQAASGQTSDKLNFIQGGIQKPSHQGEPVFQTGHLSDDSDAENLFAPGVTSTMGKRSKSEPARGSSSGSHLAEAGVPVMAPVTDPEESPGSANNPKKSDDAAEDSDDQKSLPELPDYSSPSDDENTKTQETAPQDTVAPTVFTAQTWQAVGETTTEHDSTEVIAQRINDDQPEEPTVYDAQGRPNLSFAGLD